MAEGSAGSAAPTGTWSVAERLRVVLVVGLLGVTSVLMVLGALAAVVGGGLSDWGNGAGGLGGWPNEFMTFFSYLVGLAAAIATFRERRSIAISVGVIATGLLVSTAFLDLAHLSDPCARGWWDDATTIGDASLCSTSGEIATRFHLVLHGVFGFLAATVAVVVYRSTNLIGPRSLKGSSAPG